MSPVTYVVAASGPAKPLDMSSIMVIALMAALLIWVVWVGQKRTKLMRDREAAPSSEALDKRHSLQRAMEELQINIMEFGRDVEARLDTKIRVLEQLIKDADERVKRLEALKGKTSNGSELPPLHKEIHRLADQGLDKIEIARRTGAAPGEVELILGLRKTRGAT